MKNSLSKRLLSLLLAAAMAVGVAMPSFAVTSAADGAQSAKVSFEKVDNDEVSAAPAEREELTEEEDASLYEDTDLVRVSIVLEDESTIEAVTSEGYALADIAANKVAMNYREGLQNVQDAMAATISSKALDGEKLDVVWNLTLAANIISANVPYGKIEAIRELDGVEDVVLEQRYEPAVYSQDGADPNMATSSSQIGSASAWAAGYTGAGSRIAVIDTGIDPDHQSFSAEGYEYSLAHQAGLAGETVEEYKAGLDLLDTDEIAGVLDQLNLLAKNSSVTAEDLYVSSKIPFGFNYVDKNLVIDHDHDTQGEHGSHVEGIAAANAYIPNSDGTFSNALDSVKVQGVAPDAQLIVMKVFGAGGGAYDSDYMVAIEDAIILGADAINLSLGSGNPGMSSHTNATYQAIMDNLVGCGAVVAMSAGNSGSWVENANNAGYLYSDDVSMQTNGSPGSYTNSLGVASVDNSGFTGEYLTVGGSSIFYTQTTGYTNQPMTTIAGEHEYVYIDGMGTEADWAAVGDALAGKIALCSRGEISFFQKADYAAEAGAIATIIYNNQAGTINMDLSDYSHTQPCVSITQADGALIKAASTPVTDDAGNVLYYTGTMTVEEGIGSVQYESEYYTMSSFSSWGVPGTLEIKPEITAPGGNIYSVNGAVAGGTSYESMSGTSMASPQVAGMAALVAQYIRENKLEELTGLDARTLAQSLLMSTAEPLRDAESDGQYYPVLQQGAGLANVGDAVSAETYILMDGSSTDSATDGKVKVELGDDPDRKGVYAAKFTVNNLTGEAQTYDLSADLFTQDVFPYYVNNNGDVGDYMDTWTTPLSAAASWTVDGASVTPIGDSLNGMDFDGNGVVNTADATAMLDYVTGVRTELNDQANADLDGDGDIDSYDAYLFLVRVSTVPVTVPANGSVTVEVTLTLTDEQKAALDANYPNGAYVEGYLYVTPYSTEEGALGVEHSIPVLGFYGNWSDPSMYDVGIRAERVTGEEVRIPYLGNANANTFAVTYADDPGSAYYFGGNPLVADDVYMPERNAINSENGDQISKVSFIAIRNAAASKFLAVNKTTGETMAQAEPGAVSSAYYYTNGGTWQNTGYTLNTKFTPAGAAEGDQLEASLILAPEYYVADDGTVDWDALGKGAYLSVPMVVDNTAPELEDVSVSLTSNTLNVTASDNQYVAAVILYNNAGTVVQTYAGAKQSIEAGTSAEYELPLEGVNGKKFLVQVYDYAMNVTTYRLEMQIGEEQPMPERIAFDLDNNYWTSFDKNSTNNDLTAYAPSDLTFYAATIADHIVFASTDEGDLYVMPEDDLTDLTLVGNMGAVLTDMAYNKADGKVYGVTGGYLVTVDKLTGALEVVGEIGVVTNTLACGTDGTFYCNKYGTAEIYSFTLDTLAAPELLVTTRDASQYVQSMEVDPNTGLLCWNSYRVMSMYGYTFGFSYYYEIDTAAKTYERYNDLWDELSCLIIPEKTSGGGWDTPTDTVSGIQISDETLNLLRGSTAQLSATVQPWTATDRTVSWSSSDPAIATVDANGTVTAVAPGVCTVTAVSNLDSSFAASCEVTVSTLDITLKGVLQDADGNPALFSWNMETDDNWAKVSDLGTTVNSVTRDAVNGDLYVVDSVSDSWAMHKVDPATGEVIATAANTATVPLWDMEYSQRFSTADAPKIASIYYYYFLAPKDPMNLDTSAFNLQSRLSSAGASYLVAVTSLGYEQIDYDGTLYDTEHFVLLDNAGNLWNWWTYEEDGSYSAILSRYATNLTEAFPGDSSGENMYSSMVLGGGGALYLSAFTGDTSNLYRLVLDDVNGTAEATLIGNVGYDVWPAALYAAESNAASDGSGSVRVVTNGEVVNAETVSVEELIALHGALRTDSLNSSAVGIVDNAMKETDEATLQALYEQKLQALRDALAAQNAVEEEPVEEEPVEEEPVEEAPEQPAETEAPASEPEAPAEEEPASEPEQPVEDETPASEPEEPVADSTPAADSEPADDSVPAADGQTVVYRGVSGGVNSLATGGSARVRPLSSTTTDAEDGVIYLNVTAKNAAGEDVASNSGKVIVTYDADKYELQSVEMYPMIASYNDSEAGTVVLAYADVTEIPAGSPVAKLTLVQKAEGGQIKVEHVEVGAEGSGYVENFHDHSRTEVRGAVEATCTEDGYTGDVYCVVGGELLEQGEVIPALGHDYEGVVNSAPDCDKPGTITYTCSRCGDSYTEYLYAQIVEKETVLEGGSYILAVKTPYGYVAMGTEIRELGGISPVNVTVTEEGYLSVANPDAVLWNAAASEDGTGLVFTNGDTALGVVDAGAQFKNAADVWTVSDGVDAHTFRFSNEAEGKATRYISYYKDSRPTATNDDVFVFRPNILRNVNKTTYFGEIMVFSLATDEAVHETEIRGAKEPTCTEEGYTGDTYCVKCDKLIAKGEVIPALGHDTELVGAKDATCTEAGYTGDQVCKVCGEVVAKGEEIPALGHKTEVVGAKAATCTEEGYTGDKVCTVCGELVEKGKVIPKLAHEYENTVVAATTASKGYTIHTCKHCGYSYVDSYVDAIVEVNVTANNGVASPKTGDTSSIALWSMLLMASVAGGAAVFFNRKKWFGKE